MTSQEINGVTTRANMVGESHKVICRYEWDSVKRKFVWKFYRHGRYVGQTGKQDKVIPMMNKFISTN